MTDRKALGEPAETPDDVATLYSWANLHGAKYRDFSAARAQTREKARLRVQEAMDEEQRRAQEFELEEERIRSLEFEAAMRRAEVERASDAAHASQAAEASEAARAAEEARRAEIAAQAAREAEWSRQQAAHQLEIAAQQAAQQAADRAAQTAAERARQQAAEEEARLAARQASEEAVQQAARQAAADWASQQAHGGQQGHGVQQADGGQARPTEFAEGGAQFRTPWGQPEQREARSRPAWLMSDQAVAPTPSSAPPFIPQSPPDTLQGSRERMMTRWFALRSLYEPGSVATEQAPAPMVARAPVLAVFSLAGGVGKTSIVATLGRALAALGERALLVDTAPFGLLPFFFGARDQRPGVLRTFSPGNNSSDTAVNMITIDPEGLGAETPGQELLANEIWSHAQGANRVIVDLATASGATSRRIMRMQPTVLVPVVPDMNSVVSVSSIDAFFQSNSSQTGKPTLPYYVLNRFDSSLPLNLDVREVLRGQLGDRLLPFVLRRTPAMSEALAEGMTVMDYAPNSSLAEDFNQLAGWVKSQSSAANTTYRGVRWSER